MPLINNRAKCAVISVIALGALFLFWSNNVLAHGFFCEELPVNDIPDSDILGKAPIGGEECQVVFSPESAHLVGLEVYLDDVPENCKEAVVLRIDRSNGERVETATLNIEGAQKDGWYSARIKKSLEPKENYRITFETENTNAMGNFLLVNSAYLPRERVDGSVLIRFGYSREVFSLPERILISILIVALWGLIMAKVIPQRPFNRSIQSLASFLILVFALSWNYMYNTIDRGKDYSDIDRKLNFEEFGADSEKLVRNSIYADRLGVHDSDDAGRGYGLGEYIDVRGDIDSTFKTDETWKEGYNRAEPCILLANNDLTHEILEPGNSICFSNGDAYLIETVDIYDYDICVRLQTDDLPNAAKNGSLEDITVVDSNGERQRTRQFSAYKSQVGLQGKVFKHIARRLDRSETLQVLHLLCCLALATVLTWIVFVLRRKYNAAMAGCFYFTFLLSPWIVNFARNLYWLEFLWFAPMLIGLLCSTKTENRAYGMLRAVAMYLAVCIKCLCGYEYVSSIMISAVSFPLVDMLACYINRDKRNGNRLLVTTALLSIAAILGFASALCIHAGLRGNGDLSAGINRIIKEDVLRRTFSAKLEGFDEVYWPSLNASVWETVRLYFAFPTEIISGIPGNLFVPLFAAPVVIYGYGFIKGKKTIEDKVMGLYGVFLLSALSWYCLAKAHSYIHTHLNYVLWYFGFIQICFFAIVNAFVQWIRKIFAGGRNR